MEHLENEQDYMDLAMYYEDQNNHEMAIKTAEKAVNENIAGKKVFSYLFEEYKETKKHDAIWQLYHALKPGIPNTFLVL